MTIDEFIDELAKTDEFTWRVQDGYIRAETKEKKSTPRWTGVPIRGNCCPIEAVYYHRHGFGQIADYFYAATKLGLSSDPMADIVHAADSSDWTPGTVAAAIRERMLTILNLKENP